MSAVQGKYFLVEESQARLSAEENVVELGFALTFIQIPKKKRISREPMSLFKKLFRGTTAPSKESQPTSTSGEAQLAKQSSISSASSTTSQLAKKSTGAAAAAAASKVSKTSSAGARQTIAGTSSRDSKTVMQYPSCMLRVFSAEETDKPPSSIAQDAWREVYQSDIHRVVNLAPVTLTALLLLPIPPIISTNGTDLRDRPIRFELWVSAAMSTLTTKKIQPDVLMGIKETTLGKVLKSLGSPKRFPHSPTCQSYWNTVYLRNPENEKEPQGTTSSSNGPAAAVSLGNSSEIDVPVNPADFSHLEVRVAFPDRLISVGVPPTSKEVEVTAWRLAPLFSGPTLRGLTFSPVSRGFQAPVSDGAEAATTTMIEPKKKISKFMRNSSTLMEFREEMAEMPLNLVMPAAYLEQAAFLLDQTCQAYVQKTKADMNLLKKLAQNDLALTATDLVQKKIVESNERLERFAQEVAQKGLERCQEMREIARFYRDQWTYVVLGGDKAGLLQRLKNNTGAGGSHASTAIGNRSMTDHRVSRLLGGPGREQSNSISSQTSGVSDSFNGGSQLTLGSGIGSATNAMTGPLAAAMQQDEDAGPRASSSLGELDTELLPPPPSTPNPFDNVMLARGDGDLMLGGEDDDDDRQEMQMKDEFEKLVVKPMGKQDNNASSSAKCLITTFRPSTSRKDRRLRFMPINMHLQVLTVRETLVKQKPIIQKKSSSAQGQQTTGPMGVRQRLRSVADTMVPPGFRARLLSTTAQSAGGGLPPPSTPSIGADSARSVASKHQSKEMPDKNNNAMSGIVPPISEEADGPLLLSTRRKGRQSIMASTLDTSGVAIGGDTGAGGGGRTRFTSSTASARNNTLGGDADDEDGAGGVDDPESFFYDTISAGAPSAHHLSSKYGGLWQMFKELTKAKDEMKRARDDTKSDLVTKLDAYRKAREMEWIFAERADVVLPQAVSIVVGSVVARLFVMAAEYSSSVVGGFEEQDDEVAQSIVKHGFLIGWESLLSTHGKELAMLGDLFYAARYVSDHCILRLEIFESGQGAEDDEEDEEKAAEEDEADLDRVNSSTGSLPPGDSTLDDGVSQATSTATARQERLVKESLDVRLFKTTSKVVAKPSSTANWTDTASWIGPGMSDDDSVWLVVARVPSHVVEKLPKVLREYVERSSDGPSMFDLSSSTVVDVETLSAKPLQWTCVLFTQGINEMQNIANMVGSRALQEEINEFSCMRLVEYCRKRFEVRPAKESMGSSGASVGSGASSASSASGKKTSIAQGKKTSLTATASMLVSKEAQAKDEERRRRAEVAYRQSLVWAAKLKMAVSNQSQAGKSFEILQNSADLVRWLSGIRIASCKSAKDRTAMSLTWEEARLLHNVHFVRDIALLDLANLFREHGTRLINVHKNTGVPRYAFNKTQRSFLPEFYRPPPNTIGGYFGMSNVT